jgi:tetratricopeptide (TPR) repeat protein
MVGVGTARRGGVPGALARGARSLPGFRAGWFLLASSILAACAPTTTPPPSPAPIPLSVLDPWRTRATDAVSAPAVTREPPLEDALLPTREAETIALAEALVARGRDAQAIDALEAVSSFSLDPAVARHARAELGTLLLRSGAFADAAAALAPLRQVPSSESHWRERYAEGAARAAIGDRVLAAGLLAEASAGLREEIGSVPASERRPLISARIAALRWAGYLRAQASDFSGAREHWREALGEVSRTRPRAASFDEGIADSIRWAIQAAHFAEGAWDSVLAIASAAPPPRHQQVDFLVGAAAFARQDYARADTLLAHFIETPDAPDTWVREALLLRAWLALRRDEPEAALASYAQLGRAGEEGASLERYGEAVASLQAGLYDEAARLLTPVPSDSAPAALRSQWALVLAMARLQQGDDEAALATLDGIQAAALSDTLGWVAETLRGDVHYRQGEMEAAYALYASAASHFEDVPESVSRRQAFSALGSERWGSAARILGDLLMRFPATEHGAEYNLWRAEALVRLGRAEEAHVLYGRAERFGADAASCAYARGWCELAAGRDRESLIEFERASQICRACPLALDIALGRGYALARLGRTDEAARAFALLFAGDDEEGEPDTSSPDSDAYGVGGDERRYQMASSLFAELSRAAGESALGARALWWEGQALVRAGEAREAIERFQRLQTHAGASDTVRVGAHLACAETYASLGALDDALHAYRAALATGALSAGQRQAALAASLACERDLGQYDAALGTLATFALEYPRAARVEESRLALAESLRGAGRCDDALRLYGEFLARADQRDARRDTARMHHAACLEVLGQASRAAQAYLALEDANDPRMGSEALLRAGRALRVAGEERRALDVLQRRLGLDLSPGDAAATRAELALAFATIGERVAAVNEWDKVVNGGSGVPDSLKALGNYHLGRAALEAGEYDAAIRALTIADSLGHGSAARMLLEDARRHRDVTQPSQGR